MKKQRRINPFLILVLAMIIVGVTIAGIVRNSIYEFTYKDIMKNEDLYYYPYNDIMYSNGDFKEVYDSFDISKECDYLVVGIPTGVRKVVQGAVKTQIEVNSQIKGKIEEKIEEKYIYIYEPFNVFYNKNNYGNIITYGGYNLIQEDREYIFCLNKGVDGVYTYVTPMLGKFYLNITKDDVVIISKAVTEQKSLLYRDYQRYEQLFKSEEDWKFYMKSFEYLKNMKK